MKEFIKKLVEKIKALDKGTVLRIAALVIALANQVIAVLGATTYANALWYQITSIIITAATALFTAWKNNDFTDAAKLGTKVLKALKDGKITPDEVVDMIKKKDNT